MNRDCSIIARGDAGWFWSFEGQGSGKLGQGSSQGSEEPFPPLYIHNELPSSRSVPTSVFYYYPALHIQYASCILWQRTYRCSNFWVGRGSQVSCLHTLVFFLEQIPFAAAALGSRDMERMCPSVCKCLLMTPCWFVCIYNMWILALSPNFWYIYSKV